MANPEEILIDAIAETARPTAGSVNDFDPILEVAGNARVVLIGEASHGTDEFYERRAELTKRLIVEKGFRGVAAEADFPDAWRVNRFVRGTGNDAEAVEALSDFKRFPSWMWRNADVLDFVGWLGEHNDRIGDPAARVGFYGLDLYSLHTSIAAVLDYLDKVDPEAAKRARYRYACFEHFGEDPQTYGYATSFGLSPDCEREGRQPAGRDAAPPRGAGGPRRRRRRRALRGRAERARVARAALPPGVDLPREHLERLGRVDLHHRGDAREFRLHPRLGLRVRSACALKASSCSPQNASTSSSHPRRAANCSGRRR